MQVLHTSISDKAYEALSSLIITQRLKPGERLIEEQLAKEMGISRTPLRDAINRLAKDGLVIIEPRKGASVKAFKIEDVMEIYDIRMALEGLAARLAVERLEGKDLKRLREKFDSQDARVLVKADTELHELIIRSCGNEKLMGILENLNTHIQLFRVAGYGSQVRSEHATADHIKIVEALMQQDGRRAEKLVREHIEKTKREIIDDFQRQGTEVMVS